MIEEILLRQKSSSNLERLNSICNREGLSNQAIATFQTTELSDVFNKMAFLLRPIRNGTNQEHHNNTL